MDKLFVLFLVVIALSNGEQDNFNVDVLCDDRRIGVRIEFGAPFRGLVFSKGFHRDSDCRYITAESDVVVETFDVDVGKCGTTIREVEESRFISNEIIVQHDPLLQTSLDSEVALSCELHNGTTKRLTSVVNKVQESVWPLKSSFVWMDLKLESWKSSTDQNIFYVGDRVIVVIYIRHGENNKGVLIKDCIAKDPENHESFVELLDESGCSKDQRLLTAFRASAAAPGMNANLVALAEMNAFRFTDSDELTLTCQVMVCENECQTCAISNEPHYTRDLMKRSAEPSSVGSNRHFMHLAMNALATRLRARQEQSHIPSERSDLRNRFHDRTTVSKVSPVPEYKSLSTTNLSQVTDNVFVVSKNFTVLSYMTKEIGNNVMSQTSNVCFPKVRFIMLTALLVVILVSLLVTTIGTSIYLKREKKRNQISSYLLYSYK